jgi:hypothetical protein
MDKTTEDLVKLERRIAELEAKNKELLAIADNTALILAHHHVGDLEQQLANIRAAVIGTRTYAVNHELSIGECVAWLDLKKLVGIHGDPISTERYTSLSWDRDPGPGPTKRPAASELYGYPRYGYDGDQKEAHFNDLDVDLCPRCKDQDIFPGQRVCTSCEAEINADDFS